MLGALSLSGCTAVLGLDDYEAAVDQLCTCEEQLRFLSGCREILAQRLAAATPQTRTAWLQFFSDNCADSCQRAYDCFVQPGTCASISCVADEECCGYPASGAGICSDAGVCAE